MSICIQIGILSWQLYTYISEILEEIRLEGETRCWYHSDSIENHKAVWHHWRSEFKWKRGLRTEPLGSSSIYPGIRKKPWRREWKSTPIFLPGEFQGQRNLAGYSPWGCKELDMTEWLTHKKEPARDRTHDQWNRKKTEWYSESLGKKVFQGRCDQLCQMLLI